MIKVSCRMAGHSRKRICNGDEVPPNTACSHDKTSEVFIDILAVADG